MYSNDPLGSFGNGFRRRDYGLDPSGLAASIAVDDPATGRHCTASEQRIHPIIDPPSNALVWVDKKYLTYPKAKRKLLAPTYTAYVALKQAAEKDGIPARILTVASGYRSSRRQKELWDAAVKRYGSEKAAVKWVARPGHSAHNTGRAIDFWLGTKNSSSNIAALQATPAYRWLVCNASRFGFTPYAAEPWHWEHHPPGTNGTPPAPSRMRPRRARTKAASALAYAEAPAPAATLPGFSPAEEKAIRITTTFETGRPLGFGGLTGNFDGQGLSFGLLQWNIGTGSLQPLLRRFAAQFPDRFHAIFGADAARFRDLLQPPHTIAEQMQFVRSINDAHNHIIEPWRTRFAHLADDPEFRRIELQTVRGRMDAAERIARHLGLRTERGLALMFDTVTQNGAGWLHVPHKHPREVILRERRERRVRELGRPLTEHEFLELIANVIADTVLPRWREDVRRRRMTIVNGTGVVHGTHFDLGRQFGLSDQPWTAGTPAPRRVFTQGVHPAMPRAPRRAPATVP